MKNQTCCFTGHRDLPLQKLPQIQKHLEQEVLRLIHQGVRYFGAGGALGFDTLAAMTVLSLRETYPHIRLILVLPCREQAASWPEKDVCTYEQIKRRADKVVFTSEHYFRGCMQLRNRHLAEHSGGLYLLPGQAVRRHPLHRRHLPQARHPGHQPRAALTNRGPKRQTCRKSLRRCCIFLIFMHQTGLQVYKYT